MRQQPQFDLGIVSSYQYMTGRSYKRFADLCPLRRSHWDILQVRLCAGNTPCSGYTLIEGRMDSSIRSGGLEQSFHKGGIYLAEETVFSYQRHNRMSVGNGFQCITIGGIPGLCLFPVRQSKFVEKNPAQLLWRENIEPFPSQSIYFLFQFFLLRGKVTMQGFQYIAIQCKALLFHGKEHFHKGHFHVRIQFLHPLLFKLRFHLRLE